MYSLEKIFTFEASHQLPYHDGKCARLHGHSWKARIRVEAVGLIGSGPKQGMAVDYGTLSEIVEPVIDEYLDHHHLNHILDNPTSENLAKWLFDKVSTQINSISLSCVLASVTVEETCTCACTYSH